MKQDDDLDEATIGWWTGLAALLGAIGSAATALRPAGVARFGDHSLMWSARQFDRDRQSRQVVEIEGNQLW